MRALAEHLRESLVLDFATDLDVARVRELLADDPSDAARALEARLADDRAVNDMLIVVADCLFERAIAAVTPEAVREQLEIYARS